MDDQPNVRQRVREWHADSQKEVSRSWSERRRLARAMRRVIQHLVESGAPEKELSAAADALEAFGDRLAKHPHENSYEGWAETSPSGDVTAFFDKSPIIGLSNPLSPPITLESDADNDRVLGHVNFGSAYEGPPGCVHGGWVAASFDEVLGFANSLTGNPGMTARLTVQYRNPTPLHTDLRFEGAVDRVEGRKIFASSQLYAGELLTAESEGLFISVDPEKFRGLIEARLKRGIPKDSNR
jgi:acyl-coenzyme A thioesterase PaaI-like protein